MVSSEKEGELVCAVCHHVEANPEPVMVKLQGVNFKHGRFTLEKLIAFYFNHEHRFQKTLKAK